MAGECSKLEQDKTTLWFSLLFDSSIFTKATKSVTTEFHSY